MAWQERYDHGTADRGRVEGWHVCCQKGWVWKSRECCWQKADFPLSTMILHSPGWGHSSVQAPQHVLSCATARQRHHCPTELSPSLQRPLMSPSACSHTKVPFLTNKTHVQPARLIGPKVLIQKRVRRVNKRSSRKTKKLVHPVA